MIEIFRFQRELNKIGVIGYIRPDGLYMLSFYDQDSRGLLELYNNHYFYDLGSFMDKVPEFMEDCFDYFYPNYGLN